MSDEERSTDGERIMEEADDGERIVAAMTTFASGTWANSDGGAALYMRYMVYLYVNILDMNMGLGGPSLISQFTFNN
jgi:hypothetical protein